MRNLDTLYVDSTAVFHVVCMVISIVCCLFEVVASMWNGRVHTPRISLQCLVRSNSAVHLFLPEALCREQRLLLTWMC